MIPRLLIAFVLLLLPLSLAAQITAIRAGRLLDPERGTAAPDQVVVVEDGKITAVGSGIAIPPDAQIIDLSHATVLPGLFDAHTHLCMTVKPARDHGNYFYTTLQDPDSYRAIEGVVNAREMLEAGFTTVRDVGNEGNYACTSLRQAIERHLIPGPTMLNAGRIIAPFGGQFHLQPDKPHLAEPEYRFADTRDEMRKAVRENIHYGARLIKIVVDDQRYIYSPEEIRFLVEEAAQSGLKVAAHTWTLAGARNAALAGVASIEHGYEMDNEVLRLAKANGVALVGTEFVGLAWPESRATWVDRLRRAHQLGVTLVYGTDVIDAEAGQTRGSLAISGIDLWIEAGVPPAALLRAMTVNAARLLGVEQERGQIQPGLAADLIAVPRDPLEDPTALKQVFFVLKDGVLIRHDR